MSSSFKNKIVCGDCIELLSKVSEPFVDLVFADPPFNIGYKYDKYHDKVQKTNYINWTRDWMAACVNVLKPDGSFYIAIGDEYAANVKVIADELGLVTRNWIIWHYTFGQQTKDKFARSHAHIFYFVKDKSNCKFNDNAVRVPSDRQLIYKDARANAAGKMPDDVWEFSRVCGTFKERVGWHPCQMPEKLLARIICASSNQGDWVLDPFNGSGTTAATAMRFGRAYTGIDISESYVEKTQERLAELKELSKQKHKDGFSWVERNELGRLLDESPVPISEVAASEVLLKIYTRQFELRMNDEQKYDIERIRDFAKKAAVTDYRVVQVGKSEKCGKSKKGMQQESPLFETL